MSSGSLRLRRGFRVQVGPDFVARDAGNALDIKDAFSGDALLRPSCHAGFVQAKRVGQRLHALSAASHQDSKIIAHKRIVAQFASIRQARLLQVAPTTTPKVCALVRDMNVARIHTSKQPRRPHHVEAWAETRGLSQADLAREIGADKGLVSRWYNGTTPGVEWQKKLAAFFHIEPESLFRHPDDDWLSRFFRGRSKAEIERIKQTLETAFPRDGTRG